MRVREWRAEQRAQEDLDRERRLMSTEDRMSRVMLTLSKAASSRRSRKRNLDRSPEHRRTDTNRDSEVAEKALLQLSRSISHAHRTLYGETIGDNLGNAFRAVDRDRSDSLSRCSIEIDVVHIQCKSCQERARARIAPSRHLRRRAFAQVRV